MTTKRTAAPGKHDRNGGTKRPRAKANAGAKLPARIVNMNSSSTWGTIEEHTITRAEYYRS